MTKYSTGKLGVSGVTTSHRPIHQPKRVRCSWTAWGFIPSSRHPHKPWWVTQSIDISPVVNSLTLPWIKSKETNHVKNSNVQISPPLMHLFPCQRTTIIMLRDTNFFDPANHKAALQFLLLDDPVIRTRLLHIYFTMVFGRDNFLGFSAISSAKYLTRLPFL